jgi:hypothetical protein
MMEGPVRLLTDGEGMVLRLIQDHYGTWNTADQAFESDQGEAMIFVKDARGESPICVNLTVCAAAYGEGLLSLAQLKSEWLQFPIPVSSRTSRSSRRRPRC